jgi:hypothetical protein
MNSFEAKKGLKTFLMLSLSTGAILAGGSFFQKNQLVSIKAFGTPVAENVKVLSVGETSASIFYNTTKDTYGFIEYGVDSSLGKTVREGVLSSSHVIVLEDLFPGETYYFKVGVNDKSFGNGLGNTPYSFTTKAQD